MDKLQPLKLDGQPLKRPIIISGPCSAETEEQTLKTARELARCGVRIFRAGIWKPRTRPGSFEGVGEIGLEWLAKVKEETGMFTATEVATAQHVKAAVGAGIDLLWLGARTTANPFAVQEIADAIEKCGREIPVFVKNPLNPDLELWIGALLRLYNSGIRMLGAIHRGFSSYGTHIYRNMPQWYIPIELRRRIPQLPLICDPSHISGKRDLVAPVAQEALDLDFDGLIIESHSNPECALSDKNQQLSPNDFGDMMRKLIFRQQKLPEENLTVLRQQIDSIDNELLDILSRRMAVSREIGEYKKDHGMPVFQVDRHDNMMRERINSASDLGMSEEFIKKMLSAVHEESVRQQLRILNVSDKNL